VETLKPLLLFVYRLGLLATLGFIAFTLHNGDAELKSLSEAAARISKRMPPLVSDYTEALKEGNHELIEELDIRQPLVRIVEPVPVEVGKPVKIAKDSLVRVYAMGGTLTSAGEVEVTNSVEVRTGRHSLDVELSGISSIPVEVRGGHMHTTLASPVRIDGAVEIKNSGLLNNPLQVEIYNRFPVQVKVDDTFPISVRAR